MNTQKIYEKFVNREFSNKYEWFKKIVFNKVSMTKVQGQSYLALDGIIYVDKDWALKMWEEYGFVGRKFPIDATLGEIIGGNVTKEISLDLREIYSGVAGVLTPKYTTLSWLYIVLVDDKEEDITENTSIRSTIKRVLKEGVKEKVKSVIDEFGLLKAIRLFGGIHNIEKMIKEPLLSFDEKIDFIKEIVNKYDGISLYSDLDQTIWVDAPDGEVREMTYLGLNRVVIDVYDSDTFSGTGEYTIDYEDLNPKYIDDIIDMLINHPDIQL